MSDDSLRNYYQIKIKLQPSFVKTNQRRIAQNPTVSRVNICSKLEHGHGTKEQLDVGPDIVSGFKNSSVNKLARVRNHPEVLTSCLLGVNIRKNQLILC